MHVSSNDKTRPCAVVTSIQGNMPLSCSVPFLSWPSGWTAFLLVPACIADILYLPFSSIFYKREVALEAFCLLSRQAAGLLKGRELTCPGPCIFAPSSALM